VRFNSRIIKKPVKSWSTNSEKSISDIVYVGDEVMIIIGYLISSAFIGVFSFSIYAMLQVYLMF